MDVPADHDLLTWLVPYAASMYRRWWVGTARQLMNKNVGRRAVRPLGQIGERVWWTPLQPSNRRLGPLDSRFEQGRYLGPMDGSNTVLAWHCKWSGEGPKNQTVAARRAMDW